MKDKKKASSGALIVRLVAASFERPRTAEKLRKDAGVSERQLAAWRRIFLQGGRDRLQRALRSPHDDARRRKERTDFRRVRAAIAQHARKLGELPNVVGVAIGRRRKAGRHTLEPCLTVLVARKETPDRLKAGEAIPSRVIVSLGKGRSEEVPVDVVEAEPIVQNATAGGDVASADAAIRPGSSIAHAGYAESNTGTLGCLVRDLAPGRAGAVSLLSCFHVLQPPGNGFADFDVDNGSSPNETVVSPSREDAQGSSVTDIAVLARGWRDPKMDAAIALLLDPGIVDARIGGVKTPAGHRSVGEEEINHTAVQFFGRTTPHSSGMVRLVEATVPARGIQMEGLIGIDARSEKGDSGAIVLDSEWNVLGMLIGGNSTHSYLVPFRTIADRLGCDLITE